MGNELEKLEKVYGQKGVKVVNFATRDAWLEFRKNRIGGSDASSILGINPWKSNTDLWAEKTGRTKPADLSDNELVQYGSNAEKFIRGLFALDHPEFSVIDGTDIILLNPKYPWAHASLDAHLLLADDDKLAGFLEIKTVNAVNSNVWNKWREKVPDYYYCQILHYLAVTDLDFAFLRAQIKAQEDDGTIYAQTREYTFERSAIQEDIDYLMDAEAEFYKRIEKDERPATILPNI